MRLHCLRSSNVYAEALSTNSKFKDAENKLQMVGHCAFHYVSESYLALGCVVLFFGESYRHSQELCLHASIVNSFQLDSTQTWNVCLCLTLLTTATATTHFQKVQLNETAPM